MGEVGDNGGGEVGDKGGGEVGTREGERYRGQGRVRGSGGRNRGYVRTVTSSSHSRGCATDSSVTVPPTVVTVSLQIIGVANIELLSTVYSYSLTPL